MRIVVTGAGGMLGQDVVRLATDAGHEVTGLDRSALDITVAAAVARALEGAAPDAIVNCAAFTDVDGAEEREDEATAINGTGAGNVARAAAAIEARLVHIGSDYVFAGDRPSPRSESDPIGPDGAYGRSKLLGEAEVVAAGSDAVIVRSSWLYGAGGRNFVDTIRAKAAEVDELSVVDDQIGSPTWTVSLATAILRLLPVEYTGIVHFANRGAVSWNELARAVVEETGKGIPVQPMSTAELDRPAPRPAYSALATDLYQKLAGVAPLDWRSALRLYLGGATREP